MRDYNSRWHFGDDVPEHERELLFGEGVHPSLAKGANTKNNAPRERELLKRAGSFRFQHTPSAQKNNYPSHLNKNIIDALQLFDCPWPIDPKFLRKKYLGLVKNFHPDHHANDEKKARNLKKLMLLIIFLIKKIYPSNASTCMNATGKIACASHADPVAQQDRASVS